MMVAFSRRWYSVRQARWHPGQWLFFDHAFADCPALHPVHRVCACRPIARLNAVVYG